MLNITIFNTVFIRGCIFLSISQLLSFRKIQNCGWKTAIVNNREVNTITTFNTVFMLPQADLLISLACRIYSITLVTVIKCLEELLKVWQMFCHIPSDLVMYDFHFCNSFFALPLPSFHFLLLG